MSNNIEKRVPINFSVEGFDVDNTRFTKDMPLTEKDILYIERNIIRRSYEYKKYISYLKNELQLNKCALLEGIDVNTTPVNLEFHHYPIDLYSIVETVATSLRDNSDDETSISAFDIASQVMEEHFKNNIGLVPVTKTIHDLCHAGSIIVPIDKIYGDYNSFMTDYDSSMSPDIKNKINRNITKSSADNVDEINNKKLEKKVLEYNVEYNSENN